MASAQEVQTCLDTTEKSLVKLNAAQGSTVKLQKAEMEIMACVQKARDIMMASVQDKSDKDRANLIEYFGGDCFRIAKFRGILEAVKLSEKHTDDQRLPDSLGACKLIEDILREKHHSKALDEAQSRFIPWKGIGGGDAVEGAVASPQTAKVLSAALSHEAPQALAGASKQAEPAPAATAVAEPAPVATLQAPKSTAQVIVTSEAEKLPEGDEAKRNIVVLMTAELKPDVTPSSDGTIAVAVPMVKLKLETKVSPTWPAKAKPFEPCQEFDVPIPVFEKAVFDPAQKVPRFETMVEKRVDILEIPGDLVVSIASKSMSPWGSVQLHDGKEETNVHHTASISGAFDLVEGDDARSLSLNLQCTVVLMLSGAGSAKFTADGVPLETPTHNA